MGSKPSAPEHESTQRKSLYRRYEDAKSGRNKPISDDDIQKHTGLTRDELSTRSHDQPGVAGNQNAGSITAGPVTGLGGLDTAAGYGGWGPDAKGDLKHPSQNPAK